MQMAQLTELQRVGMAAEPVAARRATLSGRIVQALRGKPGLTTGLLLLPGTLWMLLFVGTALVSIVVFSFWTSGFTGLRPEYTLANYQKLLKPGSSFWSITLLDVAGRRHAADWGDRAGLSGLLRAVAGDQEPYWKSALLLLFIVPFWTSYLTRTITWLPMFGREGVVNQMLMALG